MRKFTIEVSDIVRVRTFEGVSAEAKVKITDWKDGDISVDSSIGVLVEADDALTIQEIERAALERALEFLKSAATLTVEEMQNLVVQRRDELTRGGKEDA